MVHQATELRRSQKEGRRNGRLSERGKERQRETESRVNGKLIGRPDNGFGLIFKPQSAAVPRFPGWRLLFGRSSAAGCIDVYVSLFYVSVHVHVRDIVYKSRVGECVRVVGSEGRGRIFPLAPAV